MAAVEATARANEAVAKANRERIESLEATEADLRERVAWLEAVAVTAETLVLTRLETMAGVVEQLAHRRFR